MKKKIAYLISCSDHYHHRLNVAAVYLENRGYEVTYITSDFDHISKKPYHCQVNNCIQLHTKPYRKNLSLSRILSHKKFARDVFKYLEALQDQPDALVVLLPPNFLAKYAAGYKRKHPMVRLVFDIFDLWPETFPSTLGKKLLAPVFRAWSWLRDHNLSAADHIITECDLFRQRLGLADDTASTVYLGADVPKCGILPVELSNSQWDLCYLGSVNNIIDISGIADLVRGLASTHPVELHIIGGGEHLEELIGAAGTAGAKVTCYGVIYDNLEKQKIMSKCHFGLNILKDSVCIGLSMKSVDYFRNGLPIINNIPADTARLIDEYSCGINLDENSVTVLNAMDMCQLQKMRENVRRLFRNRFERNLIDEQYASVLDRIL